MPVTRYPLPVAGTPWTATAARSPAVGKRLSRVSVIHRARGATRTLEGGTTAARRTTPRSSRATTAMGTVMPNVWMDRVRIRAPKGPGDGLNPTRRSRREVRRRSGPDDHEAVDNSKMRSEYRTLSAPTRDPAPLLKAEDRWPGFSRRGPRWDDGRDWPSCGGRGSCGAWPLPWQDHLEWRWAAHLNRGRRAGRFEGIPWRSHALRDPNSGPSARSPTARATCPSRRSLHRRPCRACRGRRPSWQGRPRRSPRPTPGCPGRGQIRWPSSP